MVSIREAAIGGERRYHAVEMARAVRSSTRRTRLRLYLLINFAKLQPEVSRFIV